MLLKLIKLVLRSIFTFKIHRKVKGCGQHLKVNFYSSVNSNTVLGDNVNFNGLRIYGGGNVFIGNNFHSGKGCRFITSFHNYDAGIAIPYDNTSINKDIIIKDNVWLGMDVMVLGGVTLGEGCIIQAGSVVVSDIPDCAIAGGHPAKVFKYRDIRHYEELKLSKCFN
ncbi:acyltransferase [Odoribacter splanchnicus]|uniref:acyltransferase n=1 Tax=Odoribacter splanchnicus TaxID=28118 RepID=UPI0034C36982